MKVLHWVALLLTVVGAVNWGLVGFFDFDLVAYLFANYMTVQTVVYDVVGVAGLYVLVEAFACGGCCGGSCKE